MIICSGCGKEIGCDDDFSTMQISSEPGSRTFFQFQLCEKCHYKVMELLSSANPINAIANKG
jgi:hypothetical protein